MSRDRCITASEWQLPAVHHYEPGENSIQTTRGKRLAVKPVDALGRCLERCGDSSPTEVNWEDCELSKGF
jgi:hypothetical protein